MVHEQYKEMLAASALGALDEEEQHMLAAHLEGCADCREELNVWHQTAAWLALDAATAKPSSHFRSELLLKLKTEPPGSTPTKAQLIEMPTVGASSWTRAQRWGATAATIAFVALLVMLLLIWQQNRISKQELAKLRSEVEAAETQLAQQREAVQILLSTGARSTQLIGTQLAPTARATLAYDLNGNAVLIAKDLPPPPQGKAYQLWFIAGGTALPGNVFLTDSRGDGTLKDHVPDQALTSAIFAITLETETGASQPTGQIYLSSSS